MVAAVDFFATPDDEGALLDYLGEPDTASLHPWPICHPDLAALDRNTAASLSNVMVANSALGTPRIIRADDPSMDGASRAAAFNSMNWERLDPDPDERLVDSNASPVLLWQRGRLADGVVHQSAIGSQADSISAISHEYERWVNRVLSWVRRRGVRVWGLDGRNLRPDLDLAIDHISSIYALPGALATLVSGTPGRR
jgi:hypothetical protein